MGPSRECDGDRALRDEADPRGVLLQWGRRVNATETAIELLTVEQRPTGFNGAVA